MPVEILTAISGLVASFVSGLLGIGGGLVLTPLLLYAPGVVGASAVPVKIITGLTIVQATSGSLLGALRHRRYGNYSGRLVRVMGPTAAVAALAGALLSAYTPDRLLVGIFAGFSLLSAGVFLVPPRSPDAPASELKVNLPLAAGIAAGIGFFGGMVGIGAVAFDIAGLVYLLRVPVRVAIGTALGIGIFASIAGLIGKATTAQVDPTLAAVVFIAAVVASPAGAAVSRRTHPDVLMRLLAGLVALAGLRMTWQALTGV